MSDYTHATGVVEGGPVGIVWHWPLFGLDYLLIEALDGRRTANGSRRVWTTIDRVTLDGEPAC